MQTATDLFEYLNRSAVCDDFVDWQSMAFSSTDTRHLFEAFSALFTVSRKELQ